MERFCLVVLAAVCCMFVVPTLPDWRWLAVGLACSALLWRLTSRYKVCWQIMTALLLFPTLLSRQVALDAHALQQQPAPQWFSGTIVGLPRASGLGWQFNLRVAPTLSQQALGGAEYVLDVRWYYPINGDPSHKIQLPVLKEGQQWRLLLQLKPVSATANPSQGWREATLWVQQMLWTAQVRYQQDQPQAMLERASTTKRQQLADAFAACCRQFDSYPLWLALTLGERPFSDELWQGLRNSGLNHILSISGMHIALLFQWCLVLGSIVRLLPLSHAQRLVVVWLCATGIACGYGYLAGFAIPTQRALWSVLLMTLLMLWRRRASMVSQHLLLTVVMLCSWPQLMVSVSFWFTWCALTLLLVLPWLAPKQTGWRAQLRRFFVVQWLFTCALLPLSLLVFQGIAPWALLVNLWLVPYIAFVLFPLLLVCIAVQVVVGHTAWFAPDGTRTMWHGLDMLYQPLWRLLHQLDGATGWVSLPELTMVDVVLVAGLMLVAWRQCGRYRLLCALAIGIICWQGRPQSGLAIHVVDVGQGSAMLLQAGRYGGLIDLGPAVDEWSATEQQLLPYLQFYGIDRLEWVLISHNDSDHRGNSAVLRQQWPALTLYADFDPSATVCRALPKQWRGFELVVLWPSVLQASDNENSCVVKVEAPGFSLLNPADLGQAETALLQQDQIKSQLPSQVLVLGHHGSKHSSSLPWLQSVRPRLAIASAGRINRFHHPSDDVRQRLSLLQIPLLSTADHGAVRFSNDAQQQWHWQSYRQQRSPRWLENLFANAVTHHRNR